MTFNDVFFPCYLYKMKSYLNNLNLTKVNFVTALKGFFHCKELVRATLTINQVVVRNKQTVMFSVFVVKI